VELRSDFSGAIALSHDLQAVFIATAHFLSPIPSSPTPTQETPAMASSHIPIAFAPDFASSLPSAHDLVKHVHAVKAPDKPSDAATDTAATVDADDNASDDFVLVDPTDPMDPATPVPEMESMALDDDRSPTPQPAPEQPRPAPFIDMISTEAAAQATEATLGLTEKGAYSHSTSLSSLVDLFYAVKENSLAADIEHKLQAAWHTDPLKTLKLVFFMRDIRSGKGLQSEFYTTAKWLQAAHPETFKHNVVRFAPRFGYWKDLLELLVRDMMGEEKYQEWRAQEEVNRAIYSPDQRQKRAAIVKAQVERRRALPSYGRRTSPLPVSPKPIKEKKARSKQRREEYAKMTPEEAAKAKAQFAMQVEARETSVKLEIKAQRQQAKHTNIETARQVWNARKSWRDFHVGVAKQFAVALYLDKKRLDAKKNVSSLCAKWAPTPGHSHDKHTCIATTISLILFPLPRETTAPEVIEAHISKALKKYQSQYLTPLREAARVTEMLMSAGKWDTIEYSRVPSKSFQRNKAAFTVHDEDRFAAHVLAAAEGKDGAKVQASTLKPHEIVGQFMQVSYHYYGEPVTVSNLNAKVAEAQWLNYIENIKKAGALDNCIAIADVSGSMAGTPMQCSIALSLLVAAVSKAPFDKAFITFHDQPQLVVLPEYATTLAAKVAFVQQLPWGMTTNFQAVFNLLLEKAKRHHLKKEDMIKTIFVFSDMQFDEACDGSTARLETDYQQIDRKFKAAGYDVPKIIFWNLRESTACSTPVLYDKVGTAMVSGWNGQLLKLFMEDGTSMLEAEEFSPEFLMNQALEKPAYDVLKVLD
jgi:hypothetical protein